MGLTGANGAMNVIRLDLKLIVFMLLNPLSQVRILKDLGVIFIVIIPVDLATFVEMSGSIGPILVYFLRSHTGQKIAKIIGNSNELRQSGRGFREAYSKRSSQSAGQITRELYIASREK